MSDVYPYDPTNIAKYRRGHARADRRPAILTSPIARIEKLAAPN